MRVRDDRGQTVVEFTLMLPFLLIMLFSIVELGYALYAQVTVNNAASEAARSAAVLAPYDSSCGAGSIQARARDVTSNLLDCDEITVVYQADSSGQIGRGAGVAVQISHEHQTITPLPALVSAFSWGAIDTTWTIGACSDSRLESKPSGSTPAGADCG